MNDWLGVTIHPADMLVGSRRRLRKSLWQRTVAIRSASPHRDVPAPIVGSSLLPRSARGLARSTSRPSPVLLLLHREDPDDAALRDVVCDADVVAVRQRILDALGIDAPAGLHRDILGAVDRVGDRGPGDAGVGPLLPQQLPILGIERAEHAVIGAADGVAMNMMPSLTIGGAS